LKAWASNLHLKLRKIRAGGVILRRCRRLKIVIGENRERNLI
jgi:hypothetical protein